MLALDVFVHRLVGRDRRDERRHGAASTRSSSRPGSARAPRPYGAGSASASATSASSSTSPATRPATAPARWPCPARRCGSSSCRRARSSWRRLRRSNCSRASPRTAEAPLPRGLGTEQGRQDSNLQPPVLETGALPIAPRPSVALRIVSAGTRESGSAAPVASAGAARRALLGDHGRVCRDRALERGGRPVADCRGRGGPRGLDGLTRLTRH